MTTDLVTRISELKKKFTSLSTPEDRYSYIIELGRALPPLPADLKTPEHIIPGCQSLLYFVTTYKDDKLFFAVHSDALISSGLAALLTSIYSNATPKEILLTPPTFLQELNIFASLSPSRSNGLASIYSRIKSDALKYLIQTNS